MDPVGADRRFRVLYQQYQRPVLGYFLRRTDATSARDAAAETFLVAWRRIDDVPDGDRALPWLFGVARKVLANQRRSQTRFRGLRTKLGSLGDSGPSSTPEAIVVRQAEEDEILQAVGRLRSEDQELLRLATWEELPHAEIAEILHTSPHAVGQRLHRITKRLARELGSYPSEHGKRTAPRIRGTGGRP